MARYSSTGEVAVFTRELMDGETGFSEFTIPTATEVTKFLDRVSAYLDSAIAAAGFTPPITNTTAKLACDDWVTARVAEYVTLTQRGVGYSEGEGSRNVGFRNLFASATKFVAELAPGWKRLGVGIAHGKSEGLQFTALDAPANRSDPDDSTLAQPAFKRLLFDNPSDSDTEETD